MQNYIMQNYIINLRLATFSAKICRDTLNKGEMMNKRILRNNEKLRRTKNNPPKVWWIIFFVVPLHPQTRGLQ